MMFPFAFPAVFGGDTGGRTLLVDPGSRIVSQPTVLRTVIIAAATRVVNVSAAARNMSIMNADRTLGAL